MIATGPDSPSFRTGVPCGAFISRVRGEDVLLARHGHRVVPFVLVALGVWILHDAGTLRLLAGR
jgi:cadmium resistance protein CadD (predicted permease)